MSTHFREAGQKSALKSISACKKRRYSGIFFWHSPCHTLYMQNNRNHLGRKKMKILLVPLASGK
jgi:hypothetical protein